MDAGIFGFGSKNLVKPPREHRHRKSKMSATSPLPALIAQKATPVAQLDGDWMLHLLVEEEQMWRHHSSTPPGCIIFSMAWELRYRVSEMCTAKGILSLELFTGRRPTGELFRHEINLHKYARSALRDSVLVFVDQMIRREIFEEVEEDTCNVLFQQFGEQAKSNFWSPC
ncbi:hypothetical protein NL676_031662 [Syzygium grande]|nr:hypothetical protein NL676_031662 [Syzygium grande]